jgi:mono/diheme cytochrome c family protein
MSGQAWKTGAPVTRTAKVIRPSSGELLRQLGMLIVGGAVLIGFVAVSIGSFGSAAASEPIAQAPVAAASPTSAPSPTTAPPTATSTTAATSTATASTPTVAAANTPTTQPPTATSSPTVAATAPATAAATVAPQHTSESAAPTATPVTTGSAVSYSRNVQPIFNQICVKCHGGEETKEGLSLKSYAEVMAGSNNGSVVTPGDVVNSFLIEQVVSGEMPKKGPKLLPAQIRTLSDWVAAGAPNN